MELPTNLKQLYRHWHTYIEHHDRTLSALEVFQDQKLFEQLSWFIHERIAIWQKKVSGQKAPYTTDAVMATYRFCNIFREFDRQTIEFHTILNPLRDNFSLWLMNMFYMRMVARIETIQEVGLLSFDISENKLFYERLINTSRPRFGTPYVFPISTILKSATPTRESFIAEYLPRGMKTISEEIVTWQKASVYEGVQKILPLFGYNLTFLWTEVLIDVAYQFPEYIDLFKQFPIGPGSVPTLAKINTKKDPSMVVTDLAKLPFDTGITYEGKTLPLSAENWEGVGCEFRKYTNLTAGNGRKRLFKK